MTRPNWNLAQGEHPAPNALVGGPPPYHDADAGDDRVLREAVLQVLEQLARGVQSEGELALLKRNPLVRSLFDMIFGPSGVTLDSISLDQLHGWRNQPPGA